MNGFDLKLLLALVFEFLAFLNLDFFRLLPGLCEIVAWDCEDLTLNLLAPTLDLIPMVVLVPF